MTLLDLIQRWRTDADRLEVLGADQLAKASRVHADEIEAALKAADDEALTLQRARTESGYSERRLRELLAEGAIPNAGRKHAPRIRRGDLPRKARRSDVAFDAAREARELLASEAVPVRSPVRTGGTR